MEISGKRVVFAVFGAILLLTVMYIGGSATFIKTKANVCQGYVLVEQQQSCAATATVGRPANLIRYH